MNRRLLLITLAALAVSATVVTALYTKAASAATPGVIAVAGDVRADEYVVKAPAVVYPTPDYTVGIPTTATPSGSKSRAPATPSVSRLPVVSGYLTEVLVTEGAHVKSGDVVARLDTKMLDLGVAQATTARTKAHADLAVLDANLDTLADARAKLIAARRKLVTARATLLKARGQLLKARASLETTIALLKKQLIGLPVQIAQVQALIAQPGGPPPHDPPYPVLLQILQGTLSGVRRGLSGAQLGLAKMDLGLAAMNKGLIKIDQGFAQMAKGLSTLDSARTQLRGIRSLAVINAGSQEVSVRLSQARRAAATVTAPVDGIVTFARLPGTAVMVGAPLVRIRPDGPLRIYTYLTVDQLAQVRIGSAATVGFDSNAGPALAGHVTVVADRAVVPPTIFSTPIVHMTRAMRVTIELDQGLYAPPGTPVDVQIATNPGR